MTYDYLENNKNSAKEASKDEFGNIFIEIKNSYFFFGQWQGYNFYFFDCSEKNDNPIVYAFNGNRIEKVNDSFTDFVYEEGIKIYELDW